MNRRPTGIVTVTSVTDSFGKAISLEKAVGYGWITGKPIEFDGVKEVVVGKNLFTDNGRQLVAYAIGNRSPTFNYTIQRFGVGTGTTAARVTDVALESPITLASGQTVKAVDSVDYLSPFVLRVSFTLGLTDANGYLITEFGLFSGNNALFTRQVRSVGISKVSDFSPTFSHRVRC